jgi:AcrR family transcriptional regulator
VAARVVRTPRLPRSARRKQLLVAAQEVFVAQGYHAAAMDEIAERAGVSKPVLYQHFPGKLDLYLALLEHHTEVLVRDVHAAIAITAENKKRIQNAMRAYFDFVEGEGEAFRLVFESDLRNEPAVRACMERMEQACVSAIAETIGADTGLDQARAELLAVGLTGAAEMAARYWLGSDRAIPKDQAVEALAALAWRGISTVPLVG